MENNWLKIKIQKTELISGIKCCLNIIDLNTIDSSVVNQCIHFKVNENNIELKSFSNVFSAKYIIKNNFELINKGEIIIKAKVFNNIISKLDNEVLLERIDNNILYIKSGNFESNLNLIDETLFPEISFDINKDHEFKELNIKTNILSEIDKKLSNFVLKEDDILSYIKFKIENNKLSVVATDSVKLARLEYKLESQDFDIKIHPVLIKWLSFYFKNDEEVNFILQDDILYINYNNIVIKNNYWSSNFPDTSFLFNDYQNSIVNIEKNKLIKAIERGISLYEIDQTKIRVKLTLNNEILNVNFDNEIFANSSESIEVNKIEGSNFITILNSSFLLQILKNFEGDIITFNILTEQNRIIFKDNYNDNFNQLLAVIEAK